jgi:hypothetical protein
MIVNIPLDYMHLTCLGVTKKIIKDWIKGSHKFSAEFTTAISIYLSYIKQFIPDDFARTTRTINDFAYY